MFFIFIFLIHCIILRIILSFHRYIYDQIDFLSKNTTTVSPYIFPQTFVNRRISSQKKMTPSFSQGPKQGHADTLHVESSLAASTTSTTKVIETETVTETETITKEAQLQTGTCFELGNEQKMPEDEEGIELIDSDNVQITVSRSCDKLKYSPVCGVPRVSTA